MQDKKNAIDEMARVWCPFPERDTCDGCVEGCYEIGKSEMLYNAGYRKASEVAREIFEEIEEGIKSAVAALQFENSIIYRMVKHETYSSLMRFIKTIEEKYTEEGK